MCTYTHSHIHEETLLSHKKNEIVPFTETQMDLEMIMLSKLERERQILYITYMWNLKTQQIGECNKKEAEDKLVVTSWQAIQGWKSERHRLLGVRRAQGWGI